MNSLNWPIGVPTGRMTLLPLTAPTRSSNGARVDFVCSVCDGRSISGGGGGGGAGKKVNKNEIK